MKGKLGQLGLIILAALIFWSFIPLYLFTQKAEAETVCQTAKVEWVADGKMVVLSGLHLTEVTARKGDEYCVPEEHSKLPLTSNQNANIHEVFVNQDSACESGYSALFTVGGTVENFSGGVTQIQVGNRICVMKGYRVRVARNEIWAELLNIRIVPSPKILLATQELIAKNAAPVVSQIAQTKIENSTADFSSIMNKYGITKSADGKFSIPPITDRGITLTERLMVIEMVANNFGIPPALLKAICWQEGWDRFSGRRCENWYAKGGTVSYNNSFGKGSFVATAGEAIKSFDVNGFCAFQITLRWHPKSESDVARLKNDFTYCVNDGARILVGKGPNPPPPDNIDAWGERVWAYGDRNNPNYRPIVLNFAKNPPVNPDTGKPAW